MKDKLDIILDYTHDEEQLVTLSRNMHYKKAQTSLFFISSIIHVMSHYILFGLHLKHFQTQY